MLPANPKACCWEKLPQHNVSLLLLLELIAVVKYAYGALCFYAFFNSYKQFFIR